MSGVSLVEQVTEIASKWRQTDHRLFRDSVSEAAGHIPHAQL